MGLSAAVFSAVFIALVAYYYPELYYSTYRPRTTEKSQLLNYYDFIIVGAGSAGSVLGGRLSEVKNWSVLVIEAGGDETPFSMTPYFYYTLQGSEMDWNFTTVKQEKACLGKQGVCIWPRGKVLGGSSSINGMVYARGSSDDYDQWKSMGLKEWGYHEVLPYFLKSEDIRVKSLEGSPYHRRGGPLSVQQYAYNDRVQADIIKAGEEMNMKKRDYLERHITSISETLQTVKGAQRWSTASAFLNVSRSRLNLSILKNTEVTKLIINSETKTVLGVKFVKDGVVCSVKARKEVILSAGSVITPKLLMLSGIGPREHLKQVGIPIIADLPVGNNLQDHTMVSISFKVTTYYTIDYNTVENLLDYAQNKSGPLTSRGMLVVAFLNTGVDIMADPAEVQLHIVHEVPPKFSDKNQSLVTLSVTCLKPESVGTIRLSKADPSAPLNIDPKYFSFQKDFNTTIAGLEIVLKMMKTSAMKKYSPEIYIDIFPYCKDKLKDQISFLECIVLYYSETIFHPVGTAKMGNISDPSSVLDSKLKVRGIKKLRVVDASVMPNIVRGNTNAPTIMTAEKASDFIKKEYM